MKELASRTMPVELPLLRIAPPRGWLDIDFKELWAARELLYFFVWRDIKVRYKQTAIGAAWAVIQPFMTMVVFSLFFGKLAKMDSHGLPYPIFYYSALLPWMYFAAALQNATNVVVEQQHVITKVYFPRLVLPLSAVVSGLLDFAISFVVFLGMMAYYRIMPGLAILLFPCFLLLAVLTALGVGLWLSALNAIYRDVRYVIPFLVQFWLFASPVAYPSSLVPRALALALRAQSHGRRHRGLPLGAHRARPATEHHARGLHRNGFAPGGRRLGVFPQDGRNDCRRCLNDEFGIMNTLKRGMSDGVIHVEDLGKRDQIGERERYRALRNILARVTKPTSGFADVRGRRGSLLEVGSGYHPEWG